MSTNLPGWRVLLCISALLLGWLVPLTEQTKTSEVFKVMKDSDNLGGSCDKYFNEIDNYMPEVEALIEAATGAIDKLLKGPMMPLNSKDTIKERWRIGFMADRYFGATPEGSRVRVEDDASRKRLNSIKGVFNKVQSHINAKDKTWRFACDHTWAPKVTELKSKYGDYEKGTKIDEIWSLSGGVNDYAWHDLGAENMQGVAAYMASTNGWNKEGPCKGVQRPGQKEVIPDAETLAERKMIYFCPRVYVDQSGGSSVKTLGDYASGKTDIKTDGTAFLDTYNSPAATLLHEMTHLVGDTDDDLGYRFADCSKGKTKPSDAAQNADSLAGFAVAMYLAKYDWHRGYARTLDDMMDPKK